MPRLRTLRREDAAVVAGIEQDPSAAVLDAGRKAPVPGQGRRWAEGVVQEGGLLRLLCPGGVGDQGRNKPRETGGDVSK